MKGASSPNAVSPVAAGKLERLEELIVRNASWLAIGIIAAAFAARLAYSGSCFLNPDEALHFHAAFSRTWLGAYEGSRQVTHPPLFILVLHGFLFLGHREVILRLPSLIAGTAALWITFAWIQRSLGALPALTGLLFMAVAPSAVSASTEVRQYGLLLCFICGALYATERALDEHSVGWAIGQGLLLLAAILTHYIALIFICAVDIYVVLRWLFDRFPKRVFWALFASQVVVATVFGWLYFHHIRHSAVFDSAGLSYLQRFFYMKGSETFLGFMWRCLAGTFTYLVSYRLAVPAILAFLAGIAALATKRTKAAPLMWVLIVSPFVVGFVAAVAHVFPFSGSRHETYLLPFAAMSFAAMLTWIPQRLVSPIFLLCLVIAPIWAVGNPPDNNPRRFAIREMTEAIDYVNRTVPPDAPIFVDGQSGHILAYYLGRGSFGPGVSSANSSSYEKPGGHRIISPHPFVAIFDADEAIAKVNQSAAQANVPSGTPLWVFTVAWPYWKPLAPELSPGDIRSSRVFGTISVFEAIRNGDVSRETR